MNKAYIRINWKNYPIIDSPLNAQNLNHMDSALNVLDDRVIVLDNTKASLIELSTLFKDVSFEDKTGILTFTRYNGATVTIDTPLEKVALNIYYDPETEKLILPLVDGTQTEVDLSRLITEFEFVDSDTIAFSVSVDGKVTSIVKEGSIEEKHLRPNYLADIKLEAGKAGAAAEAAEKSAAGAAASEASAAASAELAEQNNNAAQAAKEAAAESAASASDSAQSAARDAAAAQESATQAANSAASVKESEVNAAASAEAAKNSETAAAESEKTASDSALLSQSWAIGGTGIRDGEGMDNSKYYSEQSGKYLEKVESAGNDALDAIDNALNLAKPEFLTNVNNGHLYYKGGRFLFRVDKNKHLRWRVMI